MNMETVITLAICVFGAVAIGILYLATFQA